MALALGPGLVLLGPQGVALFARALEAAAGRAARDGIGLPPQAREAQAALAAASGSGSAGSPFAVPGASFAADVVGVQEVAQVLKVSDRRARQLLQAGAFETASKVGSRWCVDRLELDLWRDDRRKARTA